MNKGIAVIFKNKFEHIKKLKSQNKQIGDVASIAFPKRNIYHLIIKEKFNEKPTYESLLNCLENLKELCIKNKVADLAVPRVPCGLDQIKGNIVLPLIKNVFENSDTKVHIYLK